jgi:hypothetical protein
MPIKRISQLHLLAGQHLTVRLHYLYHICWIFLLFYFILLVHDMHVQIIKSTLMFTGQGMWIVYRFVELDFWIDVTGLRLQTFLQCCTNIELHWSGVFFSLKFIDADVFLYLHILMTVVLFTLFIVVCGLKITEVGQICWWVSHIGWYMVRICIYKWAASFSPYKPIF